MVGWFCHENWYKMSRFLCVSSHSNHSGLTGHILRMKLLLVASVLVVAAVAEKLPSHSSHPAPSHPSHPPPKYPSHPPPKYPSHPPPKYPSHPPPKYPSHPPPKYPSHPPPKYPSHPPPKYPSHPPPKYPSHPAPKYPSHPPPKYPSHPPSYGHPKPVVKIISNEDSRKSDQTYNFAFESEDGITRSESGAPLPDSHYEEGGYSQQGGVKYVSPEGKTIELKYVADGNGFVASGDHLPTPVPDPFRKDPPAPGNKYH